MALTWTRSKGQYHSEAKGVKFVIFKPKHYISYKLQMGDVVLTSSSDIEYLKEYANKMIGG